MRKNKGGGAGHIHIGEPTEPCGLGIGPCITCMPAILMGKIHSQQSSVRLISI